jgi:hypothetical protein
MKSYRTINNIFLQNCLINKPDFSVRTFSMQMHDLTDLRIVISYDGYI